MAMAKGQVKTPDGMTIEIDNSAILKHVDTKIAETLKPYMKELKEWRKAGGFRREGKGKGVVEARLGDKATHLLEELGTMPRVTYLKGGSRYGRNG